MNLNFPFYELQASDWLILGLFYERKDWKYCSKTRNEVHSEFKSLSRMTCWRRLQKLEAKGLIKKPSNKQLGCKQNFLNFYEPVKNEALREQIVVILRYLKVAISEGNVDEVELEEKVRTLIQQ